MRPFSAALAAVLALAALAACTGAATAAAGRCSLGHVVKTKTYVFALAIGPMEAMYTAAEVRARHPEEGEVMLSGQMTGGMAAMTMDSRNQRHLEVHICTRRGAAVTNAAPRIVLADATAMTMAVPVARMRGVGEGAGDIHYGNNVELTPGERLTVTVALRGERAVFHLTAPRA